MLSRILFLIEKDFALHIKKAEVVLLQVFLGVTIFTLMRFIAEDSQLNGISSGIFWVAFFLSGNLAINRMAQIDSTNKSSEGIILSGTGSISIFIAKNVFLFVYSALIIFALLPTHILFFNLWDRTDFPLILGISFLTAFGFNSVLILTSSVISSVRFSEFMLPLVSLPLQLPLLLAAVTIFDQSYGNISANVSNWYLLLVVFDIVYFFLSLMLSLIIND